MAKRYFLLNHVFPGLVLLSCLKLVPLNNGNAATSAMLKPMAVLLLMTVGTKCCSV